MNKFEAHREQLEIAKQIRRARRRIHQLDALAKRTDILPSVAKAAEAERLRTLAQIENFRSYGRGN